MLELPDDFSLSYFQNQGVSSLLTTAMEDISITPPIVMRLRDDVERRLNATGRTGGGGCLRAQAQRQSEKAEEAKQSPHHQARKKEGEAYQG